MGFGDAMNVLLIAAWLGYSSPGSYAQPVIPDGGGGGRWFTGSFADGFDCSVCHAGGPSLDLEITGLPVEGWTPGESYDVQIGWVQPAANVSLLVEFARANGSGAGGVALPAEDTLLPEERCEGGPRAAKLYPIEQERTIAALRDCGAKLLRVTWTAPADADDDAWLFVAGVNADASEDPSGDGVVVERVRMPGPAANFNQPTQGCATTDAPRGRPGVALLGLFALGLLRHRSRRIAGLVMLMLVLGACARVQPHQRGRLAGSDMQMELDPELCAGRTHAVEYREGSAGGLGGGGGGCGCN
jgi:MYXO-CTERM domain-containing protein